MHANFYLQAIFVNVSLMNTISNQRADGNKTNILHVCFFHNLKSHVIIYSLAQPRSEICEKIKAILLLKRYNIFDGIRVCE